MEDRKDGEGGWGGGFDGSRFDTEEDVIVKSCVDDRTDVNARSLRRSREGWVDMETGAFAVYVDYPDDPLREAAVSPRRISEPHKAHSFLSSVSDTNGSSMSLMAKSPHRILYSPATSAHRYRKTCHAKAKNVESRGELTTPFRPTHPTPSLPSPSSRPSPDSPAIP